MGAEMKWIRREYLRLELPDDAAHVAMLRVGESTWVVLANGYQVGPRFDSPQAAQRYAEFTYGGREEAAAA